MPISLDEFVRSLTDTGILPVEEVTSIVSNLPEDRTAVDVEKLAKLLVRQEKLTRFQASVIFRRQSRGLRFGDYIVLDKIGSGAMGQVFKAENRRTRERVALKLLRATYTKSERAVARFYREANTAARLKHTNLVSVVDAGERNGLHFLVMELVEGRDVRSIVKESGPFPVVRAIDVIIQAARGLEYAHQHGIVHRDVKPANLLLHKNGRVVVLDLGLARLDDAAEESEGQESGRLTMPGNFLGTLDYISPEQTADAHEVDARSDIYSLGCTLYYMLKGQPPYRRENPALILFAHCQDPIPKLTEHVPGTPQRLDALFQRMLAKKAADRVATMAELIAEIDTCRQELEPDTRPSSRAPCAAPPAFARRLDTAHDIHEVAGPYTDEMTIDLPLTSETRSGPPAPISPDPLAGALCEISESVVTVPPQATSSGWRGTPRLWWTIALAALAIGALAACGWIAIRGWPG
jgi:serine/threonine protein kinase